MTEPVPILTVGDLKSELSRWSDETPVTFRSPLKEQEFRFYRYRPEKNVLALEINELDGIRSCQYVAASSQIRARGMSWMPLTHGNQNPE
jgi:hypothetical protein